MILTLGAGKENDVWLLQITNIYGLMVVPARSDKRKPSLQLRPSIYLEMIRGEDNMREEARE